MPGNSSVLRNDILADCLRAAINHHRPWRIPRSTIGDPDTRCLIISSPPGALTDRTPLPAQCMLAWQAVAAMVNPGRGGGV
jgi:hypothetical protein